MLVDGGGFVGSSVDPGTRVILPALRARRRQRLDVVVLSHPHPDHMLGLLSVVRALPVGELWDTGQYVRSGPQAYRELIQAAEEGGVRILRPRDLCGRSRRFGGVHAEVLDPCPGVRPEHGANDNSLIVRLTYGEHGVVFAGDAEHFQEGELARRWRGPPITLLKVGHHGSRTSSTVDFLAALRPRLAVISSGVGNRFGHPHAEALERLAAARTGVARLDQLGSVVWESDGATSEQTSFKAPARRGANRGPRASLEAPHPIPRESSSEPR
jgi:competence protein ComEC